MFALSDMLWRAGAQTSCCVCLPQDKENFSQSTQYRYDGLTEKVSPVYNVVRPEGEASLNIGTLFFFKFKLTSITVSLFPCQLHLYQFNSFEDVQCFLKRNLDFVSISRKD